MHRVYLPPTYFENDPGEGWERFTSLGKGYVYSPTLGPDVGRFWALYTDGTAGVFDSFDEAKESWEEQAGASSDGMSMERRDLLNGLANGGMPFGLNLLTEHFSDASGKIDMTSRAYQDGELWGMAIGILGSGGSASGGVKVVLKKNGYRIVGKKAGFRAFSEVKKHLSLWVPDPIRGKVAQSIKYHFKEHAAKVGKAGDLEGYLNRAAHFLKNRHKLGKVVQTVEGKTDGVVRWHLKEGGKTYFLDLTPEEKIISFGLVR